MNTHRMSRTIAHYTPAIFLIFSFAFVSAHAETDVKASIGLGFDDNIYKTPASNYYDAATATNITVKQSGGTFLPFQVNFSGRHLTGPDVYFIGEYKLKGFRYLNRDYANADRTDNKFSFGAMRLLNKKGVKEENFEGNILFGHQRRLYLDRDTGEDHRLSSNLTSPIVSERYIYDYTGLEFAYKDRVSALQKKASIRMEKRDYVDVPGANESQYDNTYTILKLGIDKKLTKNVKLGVDYNFYTYDYVERKSRTSSGSLTGPARKYTYNKLKAALRYRMSKAWLHVGRFEYKTRKDHYVGYDDYTKFLLGLTSRWDITMQDRVELSFDWWKRDYSNALAFDKVGQEKKYYDGSTLELNYVRTLTEDLNLNCSYKRIDENTNDSRYQYLESLYIVAVEYQL